MFYHFFKILPRLNFKVVVFLPEFHGQINAVVLNKVTIVDVKLILKSIYFLNIEHKAINIF